VTVSNATVPATGVTVNPASRTMNPTNTYQLTATVAPAPATNKAVTWTSSNPAVASVSATGLVTANAVGTATITATTADGGFTAQCAVTVQTAVAPNVPTLSGEGPYHMVESQIMEGNYSLVYTLDRNNFNTPLDKEQDGTIKLKDIIAASYGTNYSGITVTTKGGALDSYVKKGVDKDGDAAIVITYYGTKAQWDAAKPNYPDVQMELVLGAAGYTDTPIKVNLKFEGTMY
jgi:hypothetical protein